MITATTGVRTLWRNEGGFILPIVLVLFALGVLLIAPTLGHGYSSLLAGTATERKAEELHAADSGIEEGLHFLTRSRAESGIYESENWATGPWVRSSPYVLNDKNVYVTIESYLPEEEDNLYRITSRAEDPEGGSSTVLALVYAVPYVTIIEGDAVFDDDYTGDVAVTGDLEIETANTTITGTVTAEGYLDIGQGAEIIGDVNAGGDITLGQSAVIQCNVLCTAGNLTLGQSGDVLPPATDVDAEIHFLSSEGSVLTFANTASITGNIYSEGDLTITMANPQNSIEGDIVVIGDLIIDMSSLNSKGTITGEIWVTGDVSILLSKDADIYGTLHYYPGQYYPDGSDLATWPVECECGDSGDCDPWPAPQLVCPAFPSNAANIQIWELS